MTLLDQLRKRGASGSVRAAGNLLRVGIRHPVEALDHVRAQLTLARPAADPTPLAFDPDWRAVLQTRLDDPTASLEDPAFERLWTTLREELESERVLGESYDADPTLARIAWSVTRSRRPASVVETGVSRGVTSRLILEALEANGHGRLTSIDLPPLEQPWRQLVGSAVPARLRHRWTYVRGTSRRKLPRVSRAVGEIGLFVHDSLHTPENLRLELETVRPHLAPNAAIVIDDAGHCDAQSVAAALGLPAPLIAGQSTKDDAVAVIVLGAAVDGA